MKTAKRERRRQELEERITRLEQELGIGWIQVPGLGTVRDTAMFELPNGKVVPIQEVADAGGLHIGVASCCCNRHIIGRDCDGEPR